MNTEFVHIFNKQQIYDIIYIGYLQDQNNECDHIKKVDVKILSIFF